MEVTKSNYEDALPKIIEAIKNATFICVDCELTGLNTVRDITAYDTPKQYFEKVRSASKDFLIIQFGIAAFRFEEDGNIFKQQCFNCYIFRRPTNRYMVDQRFLCQSSSIEFLISNGFDFNKLFKEGIPYMNEAEETAYKENLEEQQKLRANSDLHPNGDHILIPKENESFIEDVLKQINDFLLKEECEELELPKCNPFVRKLIYQTVREKLKDKVSLETRKLANNDRVLVATRISGEEERKKKQQSKLDEEFKELDNAVGFAKVLRAIVNSGKLVVGHNLCLDLLHTVDKFLAPLPDDYEDFKDCVHCLLPKVLDTKFMSSEEPFKALIPSSVLAHVVEAIRKEPFKIPTIEVEEGCEGYNLTDNKEHEAGYDAFITGVSLLAMWNYLGEQEGFKPRDIFNDYTLLEPYSNKLFLMRLQDFPYIHLGGEDPNPSREHVFYLTFPKDWKTSDIVQLFSPFGNVQISWINSSSAYVGLHRREQAAIALKTLSQSETYSITTYARRQAQLSGVKTLSLSSPLFKAKKLSEAPIPPPTKRRKTGSFSKNLKRSIESIEEMPEEDMPFETEIQAPVATPKGATKKFKKTSEENTSAATPKGRKRKVSKAFEESSSWD